MKRWVLLALLVIGLLVSLSGAVGNWWAAGFDNPNRGAYAFRARLLFSVAALFLLLSILTAWRTLGHWVQELLDVILRKR